MKWTSASSAISITIGLVQTVVLSRLLIPQEFGLMAMVAVLQGFLMLFIDIGISNAIILRPDATHEQLSTLYWLNVLFGAVLFAAVLASTPLVVAFYHEPRLAPLMPWIAVSFLIVPFGQQFQALAQRELRFDRLAVIEVITVTATAAAAIVFAWFHYGVFALVWAGLVSVSLRTTLLARLGWSEWRPHFHWRLSNLRGFIGFGLFQMGERAVLAFGANVDYIMVGRFLGPATLGIYRVAYELIVQPVYKLNPILTRVAWPVLAKKQDDNPALRGAYLQMMRMLAFLLFPSLVGLGVVAPVLVPVVFGPKWAAAAPVMQILTGMAMVRAMWNPSGSVLLAKGRPDLGLYLNMALTAVATVTFWTVAPRGIQAVAWAWVAIMSAYAVCSWNIIFRNTIGLEYTTFLATVGKPALMSLAMAAAVMFARPAFEMLLPVSPALLAALVLTGAAVYGTLVFTMERPYVAGLWRIAFGGPAEDAA